MPLSLRLAVLLAAGSAAGLLLSPSAWRLLAYLTPAAALGAWGARSFGLRGPALALLATSLPAGTTAPSSPASASASS